MRKAVYLLIAVFTVTAWNAMAHYGICNMDMEGSMSVEDMVAKKLEKLTTGLELTEEQAAQVETLLTDKYTKKKAIKEEKKAELDAVGADFSAKIKEVLTDEQNTKYDEMKAEWKKSREVECPYLKGSGYEHKGSAYWQKKAAEMEEAGSDEDM